MDRSNDTLIGKKLDEYLIDLPLGAGGMARVYKALNTRLQRYVALKVIAPDLRADNAYTFRFEREAQSIARLGHPNIVHVYRFGEDDGPYYIAMQYIEGVDVAVLIEQYRLDGKLTDQPPAGLPPNCTTVFDYSPSRADHDLWFTQKVTIVINPSTSYCYPVDKCSEP